MSKPKFKVGDKVRLNRYARKNFVPEKYIGVEGEIVGKEISRFLVKVPNKAHSLRVAEKAIDLISPEKIIIYRNGADVVAKNTATGKTGVAKCNPADEFDFNTGAKLALERLMNPEPEKPKKPEYYTGKVVCIESPYKDFTVGKIYKFESGKTQDNGGNYRPIGYYLKELEDDRCFTNSYKFVPLIED